MLALDSLYFPKYDPTPPKIIWGNFNEDFILVRSYKSKNIIKIPKSISPDLAYLIGCILGDGCIRTPLKRKRGGYYWCIEITCEKTYADIISNLIFKIFGYMPPVKEYKKNPKCFGVAINSTAIYRFFTNVIGIPYGPKSGKMPWVESLCESKELFRHFLAGLIDTDGYVSQRYVALVQKDKKFLEKVKHYSKELLDIDFKGPTPNKKIDGEVVGWWIRINKSNLNEFIREIPLKYKTPP